MDCIHVTHNPHNIENRSNVAFFRVSYSMGVGNTNSSKLLKSWSASAKKVQKEAFSSFSVIYVEGADKKELKQLRPILK